MKETLLHPCYFGPISMFVALSQADSLAFENEDNYQKQTYRNRMYIYGANGKLSLNIPIKHTGNKTQHQLYREVRIEYDQQWQKQHWKSLQSAYRTSPFFEYYEDDFAPLYEKRPEFLLDFNYQCLEVVSESLQLDLEYRKTEEYFLKPVAPVIDRRNLVDAKVKQDFGFTPYSQVFEDKCGFIPNLSIVDLLFNEGPNAQSYLGSQTNIQ